MAVDLIAYFRTRLSQTQIEDSLRAQGWQVTVKPVSKIAADYNTEPYVGFSLTVVESNGTIQVNDDLYSVEQYWSFRLGKEFVTDATYTAVIHLLDWITIHFNSDCYLTWDGESILVLFRQGREYIVTDKSDFWFDQLKANINTQTPIRREIFDSL